MPLIPPAVLTQPQADHALELIRQELPHTKFLSAHPSAMPGLVSLELTDGKVAYTDANAQHFILGVIFDLGTGKALDGQLNGKPAH